MIDEEGTLKRIDYNSAIYFDSILGIAGTTYPIGSTQMPSNTIADVITLCALNNIRKINVRGILVLGAAMSGYRFEGYKHLDVAHTVDLGGQDVSVSSFHRLIITGVQAGAGLASYDDCVLLAMTGFNGTASKCGLTTTLGLAAGTLSQFVDCFSYLGPCTITLGTPNPANFTNLTGSIILEGQTGGTTNIWAANGCQIVINASCNGGIINIYGNARVTDNSAAGCTVNDYTKETQLDSVFQEQADTAVNINAILASETDVFDLNVAGTRYIIRNLRLKCADPGADTVTVRLRELVNDVSTIVATFDITAANFATYFSLMDMFGVQYLAGDDLQVTVQASAAGPYAVTGQYNHATAT